MTHIKIRMQYFILLLLLYYSIMKCCAAIKSTSGPFDRWFMFIRGQILTFIPFHFHIQPVCAHAKSLSGRLGVKALLKSRGYVSQILSVKSNSYLGQDFVATLSHSISLSILLFLAPASPFLSLYPLSSENTRGHVNLYCIVKRKEYYG